MSKPTIQHAAYTGVTGYGKTQGARANVVPQWRLPGQQRPFTAVFDSQGNLNDELLIDADFYGLTDHVIDDDLADPLCVAADYLAPSSDSDPHVRKMQDKLRVENTKALVLKSRGLLNDAKNPIYKDAGNCVFGVYLETRRAKGYIPFYWLRDILKPESGAQEYFLANCPSCPAKSRLLFFAYLKGQLWEYRCGAYDRILEDVCDDAAFQLRDGPGFSMRQLVENGGIYLLSGKSKGTVSRASYSLIAGFRLLELIDIFRAGVNRKGIILVEEGQSSDTIDAHVSRSMLECRQWGLEWHLVFQNLLTLPSPEIAENVAQLCDKLYAFKHDDPKATEYMARMLVTPQLDPLKVRFVEQRFRSVESDTPTEIDTESTNTSVDEMGKKRKGTTKGKMLRWKREEVPYDVPHHYSFGDQRNLMEQTLMTRGVGEAVVRDGGEIKFVKIAMLKRHWASLPGLREAKLTEAKARVRSKPWYRTPDITEPSCLTKPLPTAEQGPSLDDLDD